MFVTIAEIYTLILVVCMCLYKIFFGFFYLFDRLDFIGKAKNGML